MSEKTLQQQSYGITFTIEPNILSIQNIRSLNVVRAPLLKSATITVLTCELDLRLFKFIEAKICNNEILDATITIDVLDPNKKTTSIKREKIKTLLKRKYKLLFCKAVKGTAGDKDDISPLPIVNLFLINPNVYYLMTRKRYNFIARNLTGFEIINKFEEHIKAEFKDAFDFDEFRLGAQKDVNNFKHEELLVSAANDLIIPSYINDTYKVTNNPSYYFFDDFYYNDNYNKCEVVVYFTLLKHINQFYKLNILEAKWADFAQSNRMVDKRPLVDHQHFFNNPEKIFHSYFESFEYNFEFNPNFKAKSQVPASKKLGNDSKGPESDYSRFNVESAFSNLSKKQSKPDDLLRVYTTDTQELAVSRFMNASTLFRNEYEAIYTFTADRCFLDTLQFNRIYNLDMVGLTSYSFLPIFICNTFKKKNVNENVYNHSALYQTLRFNI